LLCFVIFVQDFSGDTFLLPSLNSVLKTDFFIVLSILRRKNTNEMSKSTCFSVKSRFSFWCSQKTNKKKNKAALVFYIHTLSAILKTSTVQIWINGHYKHVNSYRCNVRKYSLCFLAYLRTISQISSTLN